MQSHTTTRQNSASSAKGESRTLNENDRKNTTAWENPTAQNNTKRGLELQTFFYITM